MQVTLQEPAASGTHPIRLRDVLRHYPTGVTAVTALDGQGAPVGMAVGSFNSVSLSPALVAFMADHSSTTWPHIRTAGAFCANVLSGDQDAICRALALSGGNKFADLVWHRSPGTGSPVLSGVSAWIDCKITEVHPAGDHDIVIGEVVALDLAAESERGDPLIFFRGGYSRLTSNGSNEAIA